MNNVFAEKRRWVWGQVALMVLLGCFLAGCAGDGGGVMALDESKPGYTQPIKGDKATLLVYGMACPLCANNIDKELLSLPGVAKADVDMGNGKVRLEFAGETRPTPKQLAQAVDHAGFTYKGITVP